MAIGTTIDGLNAVTALTTNDEVPVWDKEASGEPTKKITASNLASSVKSLASLPNTTEMNNAIQQSTAIVQTSLTNNLTGGLTGNLEIVRTGKVVGMGYTDLSCSSNISAGTQVCSGFPAPISTVVFVLASTSGVYRCLLDASGKLTAGAAIPSGYYRLGGTYITNT